MHNLNTHMQGRRKNGCNMKEHCIISGCEGQERVDACEAGEDRRAPAAMVAERMWPLIKSPPRKARCHRPC